MDRVTWWSSAPHHATDHGQLAIAPGQHLTRSVRLNGTARTWLRCAGLPNDSCAGILNPRCTVDLQRSKASDVEVVVVDGVKQAAVTCPAGGDRRVQLGALTADVAAGENVAWFDYRGFTGGVSGRTNPDLRHACLLWLTTRTGSLLSYTHSRWQVETAPDGSFLFAHLPPGTWQLRGSCVDGDVERGVVVGDDILDVGMFE